jgi:hypothetical protein
MKQVLLLAMLSLPMFGLVAQTDDKFTAAMERMLLKLDEAESAEQWQAAANAFERVANAEAGQWLPWYYSAYSNIMLAFMQEDLSTIDPLLDKADKQIARAESLSPDNAELFILKSLAASARIRVDFNRGMQYGPASSGYATRATTLQEGNPRGWMQLGQNLLFTPEQFGGGPARGCPLLKKAQDRFATFQPGSSIHPKWGAEYLESLITENCAGYIK